MEVGLVWADFHWRLSGEVRRRDVEETWADRLVSAYNPSFNPPLLLFQFGSDTDGKKCAHLMRWQIFFFTSYSRKCKPSLSRPVGG